MTRKTRLHKLQKASKRRKNDDRNTRQLDQDEDFQARFDELRDNVDPRGLVYILNGNELEGVYAAAHLAFEELIHEEVAERSRPKA